MLAKRLRITVYGRVQGVGFRYAAWEKAAQLGLSGWVKNSAHRNQVELEAEGGSAHLETFVMWLNRGPALARVGRVEQAEISRQDDTGFTIRH